MRGPGSTGLRRVRGWLAVPAVLAASAAIAQTAPPAPISLSADATLVSDYRYRGLSQTNRDPTVQGSVAVDTLVGLHASAWASTIAGYVARGGDVEVDLTAGYRMPLAGGTLDAGAVYYLYPGHGDGATNFAEPFVTLSHSYGPITGALGANLAWHQRALGVDGDRRGGAYLHAELSGGVPGTPVSLSAHVGHSFAANAISFAKTYTDWSAGASYALGPVTLGASYVDTSTRDSSYPRARTGANRNVAGRTLLGTVGVSF